MSYEFIIEDVLSANTRFPYQVQNSLTPECFQLSEAMVSAMISLLQMMDKLDTDDFLDEHCFNRIWLRSELTRRVPRKFIVIWKNRRKFVRRLQRKKSPHSIKLNKMNMYYFRRKVLNRE